MNLLKKLFGSKTRSEWKEAKESGDVYPADSFTLFTFNYPNGDVETGWANAAYREYRYKRQCPYNFRIMVHLPDDIGETNPGLDMGAVEDYFSEMLQAPRHSAPCRPHSNGNRPEPGVLPGTARTGHGPAQTTFGRPAAAGTVHLHHNTLPAVDRRERLDEGWGN